MNKTNEQAAFIGFKFELSQRVQHKIDEVEGIIVRRMLIQAANGGTGRCYSVCFAPGIYVEALLEIELEAVDAEEG